MGVCDALFSAGYMSAALLTLSDHNTQHDEYYYASIYCMVLFSATFITDLLLLLGVCIREPKFLLPCLLLSAVLLFMQSILLFGLYVRFQVRLSIATSIIQGNW